MKCSAYTTLILTALLMGCGTSDVKESLGLNRAAPDEFRVIARPPLSVPPEFNLLPPEQAAAIPKSLPASDVARNKVLGTSTDNKPPALGVIKKIAPTTTDDVSASDLPTTADQQFLNNAGAPKADALVRQKIKDDVENDVGPKDTNYFIDPKTSHDPIVDPDKEADRIKQNKTENKPVTTGETPVIHPKEKGILGGIFQ